ncbi:MAG: hypothetical protein K2O86_02575 [Clostridia bacterium]|nr:hypothetical protein [Clostridia bacterium]
MSLTKRTGILAMVIAITVVMLAISCLTLGNFAFADTDGDYAYEYFYDQISIDPIAERFYKAFDTLFAKGEFKDGKLQYDLIANGVATEDEVKAYVNGGDNNRLAKSYGIGRDAFYLDHPDLFYIDVFSTSITAGMQGGKYVAYLDSSRVLSLYRGNSINSVASVNEAVAKYENKIEQIVTEAKKKSSVVEQIEYVNNYISQNTKYGFGTELQGNRYIDTPKADFIYTSYGALVNNESVCEGYAKSFKAVMDRLGIPCVCVQGYAGDKDNMNPHMWNYVQVDKMWYAVDVTYNATEGKNNWMLFGAQSMQDTHIEDGVVSSSGYELRYPALKPYDYGSDEDDNGMTVVGSYTKTNTGELLGITVSFEGKGALALQEEGKYLAYSFSTERDEATNEPIWSNWTNIIAINKALDYDMFVITDTETKMEDLGPGMEYIKFALIDYAPDAQSSGFDDTVGYNVVYNPDKLTEEHFICAETTPYRNDGFGTYTPAPGATSVTPSNTGEMKVDKTYEVEVVYSETLELDAGYTGETIGLHLESSMGNSTINEHAKLENFAWDGDKTITFTLTPSKMYIHIGAFYYITPDGLVGKDSKKTPYPVTFNFTGKTVVCSRVFNDGRLYMLTYGEPLLIDDTDASVTNFQDEDGNYYAESQRSQLLLVASKKSGQEEQALNDTLKSETGIEDGDIVSSSTYEINLQLCGCVTKVPNGSFMQVSFGFPEGYDPNDEDTTFKIYHYKHDDKGNIIGVEEIPIIINQYGIIARVTSFSPFTIVQLKNDSSAVTESATANVYAYVNGGVGGKITTDGKSGIAQVSDTITYDITPDSGYAIACVLLNGKVVDAKNYSNGKLTLTKEEMQSSNMLEVRFMSQEMANSYATKGMSLAFNGDLTDSFGGIPDKNSNVAGIVIGCCVAVVVLAVVAFAVWFVMKKKKEQKAMATASAKSKAKTSAVKSSTTKQTKTTVTKSVPASPSKSVTTKSATTKTTVSKPTTKTATTTKSTTAKTTVSKSTATKPTAKSTTAKTTASKTSATKPTAKSTTAKTTASKTSATKPTAKSTTTKKK